MLSDAEASHPELHKADQVESMPTEPHRREPDHNQAATPKLQRRWRAVATELMAFLALVAAIVAIMIAHRDAEKLFGMFEAIGPQIIFEGNKIKAPKGPVQVQFWTPSPRTNEAADVKEWEKVESDARLDAFADRLVKAQLIAGYRRYEIVGAGRGTRRPGAWWVSTNEAGFNLADFLRVYQDFWKPGDDKVYMEIQPIGSGYNWSAILGKLDVGDANRTASQIALIINGAYATGLMAEPTDLRGDLADAARKLLA